MMKNRTTGTGEDTVSDLADTEESMTIFLDMVEKGDSVSHLTEVFCGSRKVLNPPGPGKSKPAPGFASLVEDAFSACIEPVADLADRVEDLAGGDEATFPELIDLCFGKAADVLVEQFESISFELGQDIADTFDNAGDDFLEAIRNDDEEAGSAAITAITSGIREAVFEEAQRNDIDRSSMEPALAVLDHITDPLSSALDCVVSSDL